MAKTPAQRKAEQRRRLKESGKYEEFRVSETFLQRSRRKKRKQEITAEEKEKIRIKKREEMRKYRQKCSLKKLSDTVTSSSKTLKSKSSNGKTIAKDPKSLPKSPVQITSVVEDLCQVYCPELLKSIKKKKSDSDVTTVEVCNVTK